MSLLLLLVLAGCDKDTIDINAEFSEIGGTGTSQNTGALVFRVNVNGAFSDFDRAEFRIYPVGRIKHLSQTGRHDIEFFDLTPGNYDYSIEEWLWDSGVALGTGLNFGSGGWSTTTSAYFGGPSYNREFLDGTAIVEAGRTTYINVRF